jgi:hypothetical protein
MIPFFAGWVALACAVAALAIYRKRISIHEDDMLHVRDSEAARISEQANTAQRLDVIDRWGKLLTVIVAVYGVLLAAAYFYHVWIEGFDKMWS